MFCSTCWLFQEAALRDEKQELLEVIDSYHNGQVPIIVP